jgi:hypothetical protein
MVVSNVYVQDSATQKRKLEEERSVRYDEDDEDEGTIYSIKRRGELILIQIQILHQ